MDLQTQQQLVKDVSYMKGQLDEFLPTAKRLLEKHDEKIEDLEEGQTKIRTKVGIFGGLAGTLTSGIIALVWEAIKMHIGK